MFPKSSALFREARKLIPGGVNSPVRACKNVNAEPLFIASANGSHLWDVDGNEYIDYVLSWGPMLLGHACPDVISAILEAAPHGTSFGAPCPAEVELAELVHQAMPGMEKLRMVSSGTEATMSALRLARAYTGRDLVLKFVGCYHGHADAFLAAAGSGAATFSVPGTPGVPEKVTEDTLLAPYNDLNAIKTCFEKFGDKIAAVIVEPVAANMGLVLPENGFLAGLKELCLKNGSLIIFDEVITGFRLAPGGATERFGMEPDLATLGKIIGGGLPVGAFGGRAEIMDYISPEGPVYQAGTLSGNPLAMASGIATLKALKNHNYNDLEKKCTRFASELSEILNKQTPVQIPSIASMFSIFFTEQPVRNFADAKKCNGDHYTRLYHHMRESGIYLAPSPFETGMLSFAHTDRDFDITLEAAKKLRF